VVLTLEHVQLIMWLVSVLGWLYIMAPKSMDSCCGVWSWCHAGGGLCVYSLRASTRILYLVTLSVFAIYECCMSSRHLWRLDAPLVEAYSCV